MHVRACSCWHVCDGLQTMTWVNLIAIGIFLANAASGVVMAILAVSGVYPKAEAAGDEDSLDDAWVEGSAVPDEFHVSRPMKHWRHGYGFAFDVNRDDKRPFLVCFASGFAKRYALQPDLLQRARSITCVTCGRMACAFVCRTAGTTRIS